MIKWLGKKMEEDCKCDHDLKHHQASRKDGPCVECACQKFRVSVVSMAFGMVDM